MKKINRLVPIFKLIFKSTNVNFNQKKKKNKFTSNILLIGLITLLFAAIFILLNVSSIFQVKDTIPDEALQVAAIQSSYATNTFVYLIFILLCFGVSSVFSTLFLSTNDHFFLHLPISASDIFLAKFVSSLFIGCFIGLSVPVSNLIITCIFNQYFSFLGALNTLLIYLGLSLAIVSFIFLFGIFLSEVCHLKKHKKVMTSVMFILIISLSILFSLSFNLDVLDEMLQKLFSSINFIPLGIGIRSLGYSSLFFLGGIIFTIIAFFITRRPYIRSLTGMQDNLNKIKSLKDEEVEQFVTNRISKTSKSFVIRQYKSELASYFKTPALFFNVVFVALLMSIMFGLSMNVSIIAIHYSSEVQANMREFVSQLMCFIYLAISFLIPSFNCVAYSKDLKNGLFLLSTPANQKKIFHIKLLALPSIIVPINFIGLILATCFSFFNPVEIMIFILIFLLSSFGLNYLNVLLDLAFGSPNSENAIQMTNNSKPRILASVFDILVGIVICLPLFLTFVFSFDPIYLYVISLIIAVIFALLTTILTEKNLAKNLTRFYQK
ncbi:MAG TPA: hypothetical protein DCY93_02905 [Firmicutes bacterium]|nr:hypothetical protein [Bacillota bacterium]